jgi:hypothetical protein
LFSDGKSIRKGKERIKEKKNSAIGKDKETGIPMRLSLKVCDWAVVKRLKDLSGRNGLP